MNLENFKEIRINGNLYKDYLVNDQGQIFSKKSNRLLKPSLNKITGYYRVGLFKDKKLKTFHVHSLVSNQYLQNPNNYTDIDHIDGDKANNKASNLQFIPHNLNCIKQFLTNKKRVKSKTKNTKLIDQYGDSYQTTYYAAEKIGCDQSLVAKAVKYGTRAKGYIFRRVRL